MRAPDSSFYELRLLVRASNDNGISKITGLGERILGSVSLLATQMQHVGWKLRNAEIHATKEKSLSFVLKVIYLKRFQRNFFICIQNLKV